MSASVPAREPAPLDSADKLRDEIATDCERAWRHALLNLEKAQRRRLREAAKAPIAQPPSPRRAATPPIALPASPTADIVHPARE